MSSPVRRLPGHSWPQRPLVSGDENVIWNAFNRTRGSLIGIVVSTGLASCAIIRWPRTRTASGVVINGTSPAPAFWEAASSALISSSGSKQRRQCQIHRPKARTAGGPGACRGEWSLPHFRRRWGAFGATDRNQPGPRGQRLPSRSPSPCFVGYADRESRPRSICCTERESQLLAACEPRY